MQESSRDIDGGNAELHHQVCSSTIYQEVRCSRNSSEKIPHQQEPYQDEKDFRIKDKVTLASFSREVLCRGLPETVEHTDNNYRASRAEATNVSINAEYDDDPKDVVIGEPRNGCDKTFFDQKQDISILPNQLENINLSQTCSDDILRQNVPEKSSTKINYSIRLTTFTPRRNIYNYSSSVIPLAGQNTTKAIDTDKSKSEKDIKEQHFNVRLDKAAATHCVRGAIRGKNLIQCITNNLNTEAVNVFNSYRYKAAFNNQMSLQYACQSSYISVLLPLHACNTFNHSHYTHHYIHHHHKHNNQSECENYANELTNALSSRLRFQITNNSPYCTNSASKSQHKSQLSYLKSQSLEIMQYSPSITYHDTDDEEQLFFQLSEIDSDDPQHSNRKKSHNSKENQQSRPEQSYVEDEPIIRTRTVNTGEPIANEGVSITGSLSLSSQKIGVALKTQSLESRPIYPNVPYSPYASPYSSPRSNRRRPPLRESRRVSIEQSGSFLQLNQYKLMDQIGQGSYGLVKLAYSEEDSTHYAMKILSKRRLLRQAGLVKRGPKKSTSPLDRVYREIAVLKKLDHPNVVKLVEVLDDPVEDSLYMVFELVKQGEVLSIPTKNPLSEEKAWSVFRDTILGLEYLHYQRIIHADIKPGNLLLTECGRVKIADLGVCNEFIGEDATMTNGSTAGTPAFRAPESLNVGQNIYCGKAADIWALGATLYALAYGNVPFVASSIPALYDKIKTEELSFPEISRTSFELRDCIQSMLKKDPGDRITLPELKIYQQVIDIAQGEYIKIDNIPLNEPAYLDKKKWFYLPRRIVKYLNREDPYLAELKWFRNIRTKL